MKINLHSEMYKRVEKNLTLENIKVNEQVALRAIDTVNSKKKLTVSMIREVMQIGKV